MDSIVVPHSLLTQCRIALTAPTVTSFDLLRINVRWRTTLLLVLLCGVLAGVAYNLGRPGFQSTLAAVAWGVGGGIVWSLLGFALGGGLLRICARLLGGKGERRVLAYNLAVGVCPVVAAAIVLGQVPFAGPVLSALLVAYALVEATAGVISAERLEIGRAMGAVFLALAGMMVLALVAVLAVIAFVVLTLHGSAL